MIQNRVLIICEFVQLQQVKDYNEYMTDPAQKEYTCLVGSINKLGYLLGKHDSIRLKHWLDKLAIPVTNTIWKQNRNLYLKILLQMVTEGQLTKPFNQSPPEGPLPKITLYDIPYPIRLKLIDQQHSRTDKNTPSQHKTSYHSRKNSLNNNIEHKRSLSKNRSSCNNQIRKKGSCQYDSVGSDKDKENYCGNRIQYSQTGNWRSRDDQHKVSKDLFNTSKNSTCKFKSSQLTQLSTPTPPTTTTKPLHLLQKSLKFLGKYYQHFSDSISYKQLLQKIVEIGDSYGQNFRQVSIPSMEESIKIEKYNQRIKDKLLETDVNSMEFMNYLNSLV